MTDCNTLYPGSRKNALEHLDCGNGFNEITTGCHIIIGDGLRGTDDCEFPVEGGVYCKEAYIGRAVMDADVFISLTHFKGHESTGFGGTENIGIWDAEAVQEEDASAQSGKAGWQKCRSLCECCKRTLKECGSDAIFFDTEGCEFMRIFIRAADAVSVPVHLMQFIIK